MKPDSTDSMIRDPFSGLELLTEDAFRSLGSMEAVEWEAPPAKKDRASDLIPGMALAIGVTAVAMALQRWLPASLPLGASVLAMVLGIALRNGLPLSPQIAGGCRWIVARLIPVAIVLVGAGLDLGILVSEGVRFLGYIVAAVAISVGGAILLGRLCGINTRTALLIGAGTGICGSSAILAVAPVIDAEEDDILLSVGAINLIGLLAMFACIGLGSLLPIPSTDFGILTGTTIHAVPTVAAAAFDHSAEAGEIATLVKMGRVALLVPFVFVIASFWRKPQSQSPSGSKRGSIRRLLSFVPWFVWGFTATAILGTLELMPYLRFSNDWLPLNAEVAAPDLLRSSGKGLLSLAMAAIGLQVSLKSMLGVGGKVVLVAALVWALIAGLIFGAIWFG